LGVELMTMDAWFEQLRHPNPHLRERAMAQIAAVYDEATIVRLMQGLDEEDVIYRRAVVKVLGLIGAPAVMRLVTGLLDSEDVTVRGSCAKALAQVAVNFPDQPFPEAGLRGLQVALQDANPVVHIAAAMALGQVGPMAFDALAAAIATTDNLGAQVAMVNAISATRDPRAISLLTNLAQDPNVDSYIQQSAVSALSRLDLTLNFRPLT
jgi:bilin biosynthesis protein